MDYLTTEEVAALLRTKPQTVRWWHSVGRGPASFKVGKRRLYPRAEVEAWVAKACLAEEQTNRAQDRQVPA